MNIKPITKLSRSKVELFLECPRCFYLDVVKKIRRPPGFPFSLNNAVDLLLKREFDQYRAMGVQHPLQKEAGLDMTPANHPSIDLWRNAFAGGLSYQHPEHGCSYYGALDDLWVNGQNQYAVVDYKATASENAVTELPAWAEGYRRQLSFYQWLLRKNSLDVLDTGYLVYATALTSKTAFDAHLQFSVNLVPITLDDQWVEPTLEQINLLVNQPQVPPFSEHCRYCDYLLGKQKL